MTPRPARVLILTASYGSGHNRVAETLADEFRRAGAAASVVDHFRDLVHPRFDQVSRALYYAILRRLPLLWGAAYWLGDQLSVSSPLLMGVNRLGVRKLEHLLRAAPADHVVSVHPTPAAALSELRSRGVVTPPHTTVFTDFVAHTQWVHPHTDHYCVPAEEIAHSLTARGVPSDRVAVTGIPVASAFARPADRAAARLALGLSPRLPVLLLMAGSAGRLGRLEEAAKTLLQIEEPFEAVLVAGREERVEERLRSLVAGREARIKVFGYVDDIPQLMAAADFIVSKAGGVTLAEALAAELPIICFGSLPGQEARNARFATMAGVAQVAPSAAHLHRVVAAALRHPVLLHDIRDRVRLYRRPHAARSIVSLVLERRRLARERAS